MHSRKVYGFGETVLDIIFRDRQPVAARPGGSVLNAFVSLGRLGWNPRFISEYGEDDVGELIDAYLRDNGVDTSFVIRFSGGSSALALAFLDGQGNASYSFYKNFPKERIQSLPGELEPGDLILFGSIYASNPEIRGSMLKFLNRGKERGALIIYDPNFRKAHLEELEGRKPRILENIEFADIVRGSDEDFRLIFGIGDPEKLTRVIDARKKILIYTQNSQGVKVIHGKHLLHVPVPRISPVSTIGAGDNFNAGILHYLLKNGIRKDDLARMGQKELLEMAGTGIRLATHVCMHYDNYISREFAESELDG